MSAARVPAAGAGGADVWPSLKFEEWQDTCATLQLWTQVVGKVRLALAPMVNHWWQVTLYVTASGLTTSAMPYQDRFLQIDFDFLAHRLTLRTSDGRSESFELAPRSVADFHAEIMARLRALDVDVHIWTMPSEIENAIPFERDREHAAYDRDAAQRFWRQLAQADRVMKIFRGRFLGKCSPVHFFWGSFDLAVSRFSGRTAPPLTSHSPNLGDWVMREAYSHEVSSCGFWPGNGGLGYPAFYAYAYPEPVGFGEATVPRPAAYNKDVGQFILPYEAVRTAAAPDELLLDFLQRSYEACADNASWDRRALER
ncbi:MAG TPA: DUF5996 family protein [Xanthobacteraceae bacterium]|jgi:hypothetical protein